MVAIAYSSTGTKIKPRTIRPIDIPVDRTVTLPITAGSDMCTASGANTSRNTYSPASASAPSHSGAIRARISISNAEIGARLYVTEKTVKTHVGHILRKLELRDRVAAVIYGYEAGIVRPRRTMVS